MKTAEIQVLESLSDTLPATSDSNYQAAALCLMLRKTLEDLESNGFVFNAIETTDLSTFNTSMSDFLSNANDRFDDWLQGEISTVVANLPDVLSIGAAYVSGGATEVGGLILQRVLGMLFHTEDSRAQYEGAHKDADFSGIEEKLDTLATRLEEVESAVRDILTETSINIYTDKEDVYFRNSAIPEV